MLQQTRAEAVVPFYRRFLERFPDAPSLAAASEQEALRAWEGLGYYGRARRLRQLARTVCERYGGRVPADFGTLRELPGLGPYSAAAVASIAFGQPCAALDGNVIRVLARLLRQPGDPARSAVRGRLQTAAQALLAPRRPGDFNQAMMELGAVVCKPRAPDCPACPVRRMCAAHEAGEETLYPALPPRKGTVEVREWGALLARRGALLLLRRPEGQRWAGMWEIPHVRALEGEPAEEGLRRAAREAAGLEARPAGETFPVQYTFTHHRILLTCGRMAAPTGKVQAAGGRPFRWMRPEDMDGYPLPAPHRKAVEWHFVR